MPSCLYFRDSQKRQPWRLSALSHRLYMLEQSILSTGKLLPNTERRLNYVRNYRDHTAYPLGSWARLILYSGWIYPYPSGGGDSRHPHSCYSRQEALEDYC